MVKTVNINDVQEEPRKTVIRIIKVKGGVGTLGTFSFLLIFVKCLEFLAMRIYVLY